MKPSSVLNAIVNTYKFNVGGDVPRQRRLNLYLEGAPGIAKSSLVYQAAADLGIEVVEFRLAGSDPTDLKGMPDLADGRTRWATPEDLPTDPDWNGIIFFDELVQGPPLTQSAITELVLEGRMGRYVLPEKAVVIAAGNRRSDRSAVNEMPRHLADRLTFLQVEADVDDFAGWGHVHGIRQEVLAFVRSRPDMLSKFDPSMNKSPSPRGWAFVSSILDVEGYDEFTRQMMIAGQVGDGAAIEFSGYMRLFGEVPTIEEIMANPKTARVPEGQHAPAMLYAVATSLARHLSGKTAKVLMQYIERIPEEFGVLAVRDALVRDTDLRKVAEVKAWAARNASLII